MKLIRMREHLSRVRRPDREANGPPPTGEHRQVAMRFPDVHGPANGVIPE
jgi:hypothetical protein